MKLKIIPLISESLQIICNLRIYFRTFHAVVIIIMSRKGEVVKIIGEIPEHPTHNLDIAKSQK